MRQMLKMSFSKFKKLCSIALIPRILRDEISLTPGKLGKRPLDGMWKMAKSTDSKNQELECEKCKKLIDMLFGPEKPDSVLKQTEANTEQIHMDTMQKVIPPSIAVSEKSNETEELGTENISPIECTQEELKEEKQKSIEDNEEWSTKKEEDNVLKSTTVKAHEEQLAQKMDTIEEPGLVEAATPKIDGFNIPPKVLGSQENNFDNHNYLYTIIAPEGSAFDEIAKKCLSSPPDKIDERIIEEMNNCGMLESGRKKSSPSRSDCCTMKSHEKETGSETKKEENTFYFTNQQTPSSLHGYPPMRYDSTKFAHRRQSIYSAYFKNVPIGLIKSGSSDQKTDGQKKVLLEHKLEKVTQNNDDNILVQDNTKILNADNSITDSSVERNPSVNNKITLEENTKESTGGKEDNLIGIIEKVEFKLREIPLTAPEISRLPGETECEPDFDSKNLPKNLPWNQTIHVNAKLLEEKNLFDTDINNDFFSDVNNPPNANDWYRQDPFERPFNNTNTAISGTFPQPKGDEHAAEREALSDTAISARQDPAEYFDLSHCKTNKVNDNYVTNTSSERSIAAYYQYTTSIGTDEAEDTQNVLLSSTNTPQLFSPELGHSHEIEKQEFSKTIKKDISVTMGPIPQLKDIEEEIPLTEMLRRVRERNRTEYYHESNTTLAAEPAEASKCHPPLDKPGKTLGPGPCRPKPKPSCPPPPPPCPPPASPCKPKDPCAKFSKAVLMGDKIKEIFSLVLHVAFKPGSNACKDKMNAIEPLKLVVFKDDMHRANTLGTLLLSSCLVGKEEEYVNEDVILAKDYEPWSPIPSWPMPKEEKKQPFVCPKEGCKINPPPRLNPPCEENPCKDLPKRSFSFLDGDREPFYLYNTDH